MKKGLTAALKWAFIILLLWWVGKNPETASSILQSAIRGGASLVQALTSALPQDGA